MTETGAMCAGDKERKSLVITIFHHHHSPPSFITIFHHPLMQGWE